MDLEGIKKARVNKGLSTQYVAARIGIDKTLYECFEKGYIFSHAHNLTS